MEGDSEGPPIHKKSGRPCICSERTTKILQYKWTKNHKLLQRNSYECEPTTFPNVSTRTLQHHLCDNSGFQHCAPRKPQLNNQQRKIQIIFQRNTLLWIWRSGKLLLRNDEATFTVTGNYEGKIWLQQGSKPLHPRYTESTVKHPIVMMWGSFGYPGVESL